MKKLMIVTLSSLISSTVFASNSVSLGYSQGKFAKADTLKGFNLKYSHEFDNQWGLITSATYMKAETQNAQFTTHGTVLGSLKVNSEYKHQYSSLLIGPTYRVNEYINLYGTLGLGIHNAKAKATVSTLNQYNRASSTATKTKRTNALAYGAGAQINVTPSFLIDVGYEGTNIEYGNKKQKLNSFVVGVGYKF